MKAAHAVMEGFPKANNEDMNMFPKADANSNKKNPQFFFYLSSFRIPVHVAIGSFWAFGNPQHERILKSFLTNRL